MGRFAQVGIAIGALGIVLALMGLFPQLTGATDTAGIGLVQVTLLLVGYSLLVIGAVIYAKFTFYLNIPPTLIQQIGLRLTMTGILFASLAGYADIFGFGSHVRTTTNDIFFGGLQAVGLLFCFGVSSFGVIIYALMGNFALLHPVAQSGQESLNTPAHGTDEVTKDPLATQETATIVQAKEAVNTEAQ